MSFCLLLFNSFCFWFKFSHWLLPLLLKLHCDIRLSRDISLMCNRANMGPTWVLSAPDGPHAGPMNLAIRFTHVVNLKPLLSWNVACPNIRVSAKSLSSDHYPNVVPLNVTIKREQSSHLEHCLMQWYLLPNAKDVTTWIFSIYKIRYYWTFFLCVPNLP